jgi:hypothetical protein
VGDDVIDTVRRRDGVCSTVVGELGQWRRRRTSLQYHIARLLALGAESDAVNKMPLAKSRQVHGAMAPELCELDMLLPIGRRSTRPSRQRSRQRGFVMDRACKGSRRERDRAWLARECAARGALGQAARLAQHLGAMEGSSGNAAAAAAANHVTGVGAVIDTGATLCTVARGWRSSSRPWKGAWGVRRAGSLPAGRWDLEERRHGVPQ